jgi:hypothetical protein
MKQVANSAASLILRPWRWRRNVLPKKRWVSNGLYGVIFQVIELFITTAVRTSNPTDLKIHASDTKSLLNYYESVQFTAYSYNSLSLRFNMMLHSPVPTGTPSLKFIIWDILVILMGNKYILIIYHAEFEFLLVWSSMFRNSAFYLEFLTSENRNCLPSYWNSCPEIVDLHAIYIPCL